MESEEQSLEYLAFDRLEPTGESIDSILSQLHSDHWKSNFESMNSLRSVNKFRRPELVSSLPDYVEKIVVFVDSPRSSISKQALILLSEVFSSFDSSLIQIAVKLSPLLLVKSTNEKAFLKQEAGKAILTISENFFLVPEVLEVFRSACFHKSANVSQNAFNCVNAMLKLLPGNQALEVCLSLDSCSRQSVKIAIRGFVKGLSESWQGFGECLDGLEERKKKIVQGYLVEKNNRVSIRDQIKADRTSKRIKEGECLDNNS